MQKHYAVAKRARVSYDLSTGQPGTGDDDDDAHWWDTDADEVRPAIEDDRPVVREPQGSTIGSRRPPRPRWSDVMNEADEEDLYQRMRWTPVDDLPELAPEALQELTHEPQGSQVLAKARPALATTLAWQAPTPDWTEMVANADEEEEQHVAELRRLQAMLNHPSTADDVARPPKWRLDKNGKYTSRLSPTAWLTAPTSSTPLLLR